MVLNHSDEIINRWVRQAEHDLENAKKNLDIEAYDVSLILCQQAVEKMLKALYLKHRSENPPKVHSLVYLAQTSRLELPDLIKEFLENLDEVSVPTRYPEELDKILMEYDEQRTRIIFEKTKEAMQCLMNEVKKS